MSKIVYIVKHTDGIEHVVQPWAKWPICGSTRLAAEVVAVLDSGDVPLVTTCPDCIKALDEEEQ